MQTIVAEIRIPGPPEPIWSLVTDPALLGALTPLDLDLSPIDTWPEELTQGQVLQFNIRTLGLPILWACELVEVEPPTKIVARQRTSPFRFWQLTEMLYPVGNDTIVEDCICYDFAGGSLTTAMTAPLLVPRFKQIIAFRQNAIHRLVESAILPTAAAQGL